jgi:hypothetical protein
LVLVVPAVVVVAAAAAEEVLHFEHLQVADAFVQVEVLAAAGEGGILVQVKELRDAALHTEIAWVHVLGLDAACEDKGCPSSVALEGTLVEFVVVVAVASAAREVRHRIELPALVQVRIDQVVADIQEEGLYHWDLVCGLGILVVAVALAAVVQLQDTQVEACFQAVAVRFRKVNTAVIDHCFQTRFQQSLLLVPKSLSNV